MTSDGRHPIKLVSDFIMDMKHLITDRDFPLRSLNRFFTVSARNTQKEWQEAKKDPETKREFIEKMKLTEKEMEEDGMLKKKEHEDE
jgi:hypothetical protein